MHRLFPVAVSGPVLVLVPRLMFAMAPLVTERGHQVRSPQRLQPVDAAVSVRRPWSTRLSSCGSQASQQVGLS